MDGILYKGRMSSQDGPRPLTSVEKELAGERCQGFLGAPVLGALALLGSRGDAGRAQSWPHPGVGGPDTAICKNGVLYARHCIRHWGGGERAGERKMGCGPRVSTVSGRSRL